MSSPLDPPGARPALDPPGARPALDPPGARPALDPARVAHALRRAGAARVEVLGRAASTSTTLREAVAADPDSWPDRSVVVADHQESGRGRAGRTWQTPPRAALTVSVLLRPRVPVERLGWVPLLAGLATVRALGQVAGVRAVLKWPNDVLVDAQAGAPAVPGWGTRRKVAGILTELVPDGPAVVVGVGLNVSQGPAELPVPSATSLAQVAGTAVDRTDLLEALVSSLGEVMDELTASQGGSRALAEQCAAACATLGEQVRVDLPGDRVIEGRAVGLDAGGALEVRDRSGALHAVLAGDVHHVRLVG